MSREALRRYLGFLLVAAAAAVAAGLAGWLPTRAAAGREAVGAMVAALAVCWVGSALGGLPIARSASAAAGRVQGEPARRLNANLAAMGLRIAAVAAGAVAVAVAGRVPRGPFLLWIGIGYLALLVVDTLYAIDAARAADRRDDGTRTEPGMETRE